MKKEIMLTLAISMAVLPSATAAFAAQSTDAKQVSESKFTTLAQSQPLEISGKIAKISEGEMTVAANDGKVYQVPLWKLSKIEGFSDLGLKVGTELTLKSTQPNLASLQVVGTATQVAMNAKPIDVKTLTIADGKLTAITAVDTSKLVKGSAISFTAVPNIKAVGHADVKVLEGTNITAATANATATAVTVAPTATLTAVTGFVPDSSKIQPGKLEVVENAEINEGALLTPADGSFTLSAPEEGTQIFIAGEITANGKNLKLNK